MHLPEVSILIVAHNSKAVLPGCLLSLAAATQIKHEVIVVDNASSDGTALMIRTDFPQVTLVENRYNVGFAVAVNQANRLAQGRYLLLLNPDTITLSGMIDHLIDFMDVNAAVGIVAPSAVDERGKPASNTQEFHTANSLFWRSQKGGPLYWLVRHFHTDVNETAFAVYGCALLIRADLYDSLGGLDERFFLYEEDIDLCYRVHCLGFAIVKLPEIVVVHYGGRSSDYSDISPEQQHLSTFVQRLQSRSVYARKHFTPWAARWLHAGYAITGLGFLLFSFLNPNRQIRTRRRTIGQNYLKIGIRGLL